MSKVPVISFLAAVYLTTWGALGLWAALGLPSWFDSLTLWMGGVGFAFSLTIWRDAVVETR